jgi:transcriptional regulator with XRE-family HTH domain
VAFAEESRGRFREIADFLRRCRARTTPEQVGLTAGRRQRLTGLRREQVAQLAGISEAWYARLEQGSEHGVSGQVLNSVADALRLEPVERGYLLALAADARLLPEPDEETLTGLRQLVDCLDAVPAFVVGPRWDILVWNRAAGALYGLEAMPADRRNVLWLLFGSPHVAAMTDDWEAQARATVAEFRLAWARHLEQPCFTELISELSAHAPLFGEWWLEHDVRATLARRRTYRHPVVGCLQVNMHLMRVHNPAELWQVIVTPQPGTGADARLRQLVKLSYGTLASILCSASAAMAALAS